MQEKVPNLGWLIVLLSISPKHKWENAAVTLLMETLDRSVLWACKFDRSLVERYQVSADTGGRSLCLPSCCDIEK